MFTSPLTININNFFVIVIIVANFKYLLCDAVHNAHTHTYSRTYVLSIVSFKVVFNEIYIIIKLLSYNNNQNQFS